MSNLVETSSLSKRYQNRLVLDQVSLAVPEGSVYGFCGPNGAGKTTTMKLLLGLLKPSSGEIRLFGEPMNQRNRLELLRRTGSLIESPSCYGHLTGQENLEIAAELKGVPKQDIDRVLDIVRLTEDRKRLVKQYSLGMRQRLGIAQALLGNPRLLILDEPTNGLDPAGIQEMRDLIQSMPKRYGTTVMISSHLLDEMERMVNQVGILNKGHLLFQGPLTELRRHSQGDISLRVLHPEKAASLPDGTVMEDGGLFHIPAMSDAELAALTQHLGQEGAGIVELLRHTKSLEELFLSMTGEKRATA